eukprot:Nk52_evm17s277 gene=Nk52_evmTU17s277
MKSCVEDYERLQNIKDGLKLVEAAGGEGKMVNAVAVKPPPVKKRRVDARKEPSTYKELCCDYLTSSEELLTLRESDPLDVSSP